MTSMAVGDRIPAEQKTITEEDLRSHIACETGKAWPWGNPVATHEIGPYFIVEAKDNDDESLGFHPYIAPPDGRLTFEDMNHSYRTMDEALVAAVVMRNEWEINGINAALNERLSGYVARILGLGDGE